MTAEFTGYDFVPEEIDRLHDEAELLIGAARLAGPVREQELRDRAGKLIRKAAHLREQVGDEE